MYGNGASGANGNADHSATGYLMLKYVSPDSNPYRSRGADWRPYIVYRLGRFYLDYIEALNEIDPNNEDIEIYWDRIRSRAGLPSIFDTYPNIKGDKELQLEYILRERQVELAFEGKRYWDIWRWLLYDGGQDPVLPLSDINTCNALGVEQLNGTHRTAKYVDVNPSLYPETSEEDPLLAIRAEANIGANVDSPTFKEDLLRVANFWTQYFKFGDSLDPVDQDTNKDQANISWRGNYYINGLSKTILDNNPWLGQTVGWGDQNGASGTITFQDSGNITVE